MSEVKMETHAAPRRGMRGNLMMVPTVPALGVAAV